MSDPGPATHAEILARTSSAPSGPEPLSPSPHDGSASPRRGDQRGSTLQLTRRASAQERINGILETARERAESHGSATTLPSPRLQPLLRNELNFAAGIDEESSGDDQGVVIKQPRRGPSLNYQTTSPATSSGPRPRKSAGRKSTSFQGLPRTPTGGPDRNGDSNGGAAGSAEDEKGWWQKTFAKFQSIELENKGSVARDHLALERTFLAWLRTSLAFASIGIAITQLFRLNTSISNGNGSPDTLRHLGKPLGTTFLAISIVILFLGYHRYFQAQNWVIKGKFPASRGTIILVSLVTLALMVVALVVVIVVQPSGGNS